jgi:hypothetical protein
VRTAIFDVVELLVDVPECDLHTGMRGAIVECYNNQATTAKRDKKERSSFLPLLICPALSGYPS